MLRPGISQKTIFGNVSFVYAHGSDVQTSTSTAANPGSVGYNSLNELMIVDLPDFVSPMKAIFT